MLNNTIALSFDARRQRVTLDHLVTAWNMPADSMLFGSIGRYVMNVAANEKQTISEPLEQRPSIVLTTVDHERLIALLNTAPTGDSSVGKFLREELNRADVVTSTVASISLVTMGCEVTFTDHESGRIRHVRLVYPDEVNSDRCVSVLSAEGSALIGLGPGQSICWSDHGKERSLTVLEVHPKRQD